MKNLDLSNQDLYEVDFSDIKYKDLETLDISNNKIYMLLSEQIKGLDNITSINASNNPLSVIPKNIDRLQKLRYLDISNCQLTSLPSSILQLDSLLNQGEIKLNNNRFNLPPELEKNSSGYSIVKYILREDKTSLNECKMILLGDGDVGKTAIVNRLTSNKYIAGTKMTRGIDINAWRIQSEMKTIKIGIWDFGGQEIMHAMHQFFMTKRSIYLLVLDARRENDVRVENWLKLIRAFGGDSPTILVVNKCDDGNYVPDTNKLLLKYNLVKIIHTSCKENLGIDELKETILELLGRVSHIHDQVPVTWLNIKDKVRELTKNYISLDEFSNLCDLSEVSEYQEKIRLLNLLNDLGVLFNYGSEENPDETNILNPKWLTGAIYKILNSSIVFKQSGKIKLEEIKNILVDSNLYPEHKHKMILGMMEKFELCYYNDSNKFYYIPDTFPPSEPLIQKQFQGSLQIDIQYDYLPMSIMSRFIVKSHILNKNDYYWKNGTVLINDLTEALILQDHVEKKISIKIKGATESKRRLLNIILQYFEEIHNSISNLKKRTLVNVPNRPGIKIQLEHLYQLEILGEKYWIPEGMKEKINIKEILSGFPLRQEIENAFKNNDLQRLITLRDHKKEGLERLKAKDAIIREKANQYASKKIIPYKLLLVVGFIILIYSIFIFGWDKMEPITWVISVSITLLLLFTNNYLLPNIIRNKIYNQEFLALSSLYDFDHLELEKLATEIKEVEHKVSLLEN